MNHKYNNIAQIIKYIICKEIGTLHTTLHSLSSHANLFSNSNTIINYNTHYLLIYIFYITYILYHAI